MLLIGLALFAFIVVRRRNASSAATTSQLPTKSSKGDDFSAAHDGNMTLGGAYDGDTFESARLSNAELSQRPTDKERQTSNRSDGMMTASSLARLDSDHQSQASSEAQVRPPPAYMFFFCFVRVLKPIFAPELRRTTVVGQQFGRHCARRRAPRFEQAQADDEKEIVAAARECQ